MAINATRGEGGAPLPHIDDLVALPRDIDPNQSVKRLLELADAELRQSEASRQFNRPADAFKQYIKAYIIAVSYVNKHRDYATLVQHGNLGSLHKSLLRRLEDQNDIYDKIKRDIRTDNLRSGVQPTISRSSTQSTSTSKSSLASSRSSNPPPTANGHHRTTSDVKAKPAIHPKPQALQGNSIAKHGRSGSSAGVDQDLAARFANLRGPQAFGNQMSPPKPAGPREMPTGPKTMSLNTDLSSLPKMPEAIYTPSRVNSVSEASRGPTATPRSPYSRHGSVVSTNGAQPPDNADYFNSKRGSVASVPSMTPSASGSAPRLPLKIPHGDAITPEELFGLMKQTGSILIIDLRTRDDFNKGHIMCSNIICIEPNILQRDPISADDISESMVLSPASEKTMFDRRSQYDLVVFYDEDSQRIPSSSQNADDLIIISLHRALVHLNYGNELKSAPKILKGGLEAWVDLVGPVALRSTVTDEDRGPEVRKGPFQRRKSKYLANPLRPDEAKVWKEALRQSEEPSLHRSTDSFLRRYPPVLLEKESMTSSSSSISAPKPPKYGTSHKHDLTSDMPSPPARPAPAVPRTAYSSLSQLSGQSEGYTSEPEIPRQELTKYNTGLSNPHNWCYANSTLQSLLASPDFGKDLADSTWKKQYTAPRKPNEHAENPQFMVNFISIFFHWMRGGTLPVMKADKLMAYSQAICRRNHSSAQFGGVQQQDAQEFMSFIMDHLDDETNSRRDRIGNAAQPKVTFTRPLVVAATEYWKNHLEYSQSIVDRYWRGLELSTVECSQCHTKTYTFSPFEWIPAPVNTTRVHTLDQALRQHIDANTLDDFSCDKCRCQTRAIQTTAFARLPPLLCVGFRRFNYSQSTGDIRKSTAPITWDFNDFDFSPYFLDSGRARSGAPTPPGSTLNPFEGPFRYECYAVIVHAGSRTDNGHYLAYVRDSSTHDPYAWLKCDDSRVTKVRIGSGDRDDIKGEVFKSGQDRVPYLVFFRRKAAS